MERRQLFVDTKGGADFPTVADALKAAAPGDLITLRVGLYEEKVHLNKEVEVAADDAAEKGEVVITSGVIITSIVTLRNISVQQQVDVRKGVATLVNCQVRGGSDGVRVCGDAKAVLEQCDINDITGAGGDGVYIQEGGIAHLNNCEISNCRVNAVHVKGGDVVMKNCRLHDCDFGVYFRKGGKGSVEECTLERLKSFGLYVTAGSDPLLSKNTIRNCDVHGILISQQGSGTVRDNTIEGSVRILRGCTPTLAVNSVTGLMDNEVAVAA